MNLYEIRKRAGYEANAKQSQKNAVRTWLQGLRADYQFAVTLTIKTSIPVLTERGAHIRRITRRDCDAIAARFVKKLNRQAFGKAAERYNKSLRFIPVVEGERSGKNLHFHLAIGGLPSSCLPNQLPAMVRNAINLVRELDEQHDVQVMDSGWIEYFTKELGRNDTDNVLWQLA
jgi:hypothetical protein